MNRISLLALGAVLAIGAGTPAARAQAVDTDLLPPNAKPGECYARVFVPPAYKTETERILVKEASEKLEIVPARFDWVDEKVLVREASHRIEVVPATYEWVDEKVLVKPATKRIEQVPARYKTVTEKVLDRPAHTVWKKGEGPIQRVDNATGEIMCLVEVPAKYKTVTRKVLETPATTREIDVPAEYRTIRKQVLKTPATTRKVEVPAQYKTVRVRKEVAPSRVQKIAVPAQHDTLTKTAKVSDGMLAWKPILCRTNMTTDLVSQVQRALQRAGHDPGPIDGMIGSRTQEAIASFQARKGLAQGGLTIETLKALGLQAPDPAS